MAQSPSSSVQAAREALAKRLKNIRLDSGLLAKEVAERAGWYPSKASRLENATTPPSDADIREWCTICGVPDEAADLIAASRSAQNAYVEWKRLQRTGLRRLQESYVPLYERTRSFRVYCSNVVPGLLQTPEYATALLSAITAFRQTPNDVTEAVAARVKRARVLRHGDHRFAILVEEAVLRHRMGGAEVMAGQLGHLLSVMSLPAVSLGIVPFTNDREMWPLETFSIYDTEQAQVETLTAAVNLTAPSEMAQYVKAFEMLSEMAVYGGPARALITEAIGALG
ncbi:helix-turn-helix transcriptional regulator [Streptomyces sp. A1547]|uniref:helix-turn-helix domain-containing protein n=1 Tax=Streptomyces sp. A1547 TaxID=2563105 RepID=UPI00109E7E30|nr:helix-turn-helix transcriptional regulator [Streptomyces sp. A1547]THA41804.1 XRE family transcriptional regulator [Streptomyces sp. A1547]